MGAKGWGWPGVFEYFKKIEDADFASHPLRGRTGPVPVASVQKDAHVINQHFLNGCAELGFSINPDYNAETCEGVGYYQINAKRGLRISSAKAYLRPASRRKNLTILTHAETRRLEFKDQRCTGIAYVLDGEEKRSAVGREVILCAGAIGSPVILQRSGIGDSQALKTLGIEVMQHLPEVGRNLQDHLGINYCYRSKIKTLNDQFNSAFGCLKAGLSYLLARSGPLSASVNQSGGFVRTSRNRPYPNIQLYLQAMSYLDCPPGTRPMIKLDRFSAFSIGTSQCRPSSRGRVMLASRHPEEQPMIEPGYLSTQHDLEEALEAARLIRRIAATRSMRNIIECEIKPGESLQSDDELLEDFKTRADTVFHPSCTCRIGQGPSDSVVDSRLVVHGLENLRVIDASVFPVLPSGNIHASAVMVGEKGADLVLSEAR